MASLDPGKSSPSIRTTRDSTSSFGYLDAEHAWEKFPTKLREDRRETSVTGYIDDLITDRGIDFTRTHRAVRSSCTLRTWRPIFTSRAPEDEIALHKGKFVEVDPDLPLKASYAAMVTRLDRNIGRLLETIRQLDLSRETLIVFTSDHGATFESGNGGRECGPGQQPSVPRPEANVVGGWRAGAGLSVVAGAMSRRERSARKSCNSSTCLPTFVAAAGGTVEEAWHVDGINLLDVWTGKSVGRERMIFWEWQSERSDQIAAMRGPFKLVIYSGGKSELYDVVGDPAERRDVSAEHPELTARNYAKSSRPGSRPRSVDSREQLISIVFKRAGQCQIPAAFCP